MALERARNAIFALPRAMLSPMRSAAARRAFRRRPLPFGFIVGPPHTGTTLLARILSEHRQVFVPNHETRAFWDGADPWRVLQRLALEAHARKASMVVEKTPGHIRSVDAIREALPGSKFVVAMRDGRDVAASIGARFGGDFDRGVRWWTVAAGHAARHADQPYSLLCRYEDLVVDPAARVADICAFLGLPFKPDMMDFHTRQKAWGDATNPSIAAADALHQAHVVRRQAQVNSPIYDARGEWRTKLPEAFVAAFAVEPARSLMQRFGYEP